MERPYHLIESKIKKIEMFVFPNPVENGTIEGFEQFEAGLIAAPRPEDGEDDLVVTGDVVEGNPLSVAHEGVSAVHINGGEVVLAEDADGPPHSVNGLASGHHPLEDEGGEAGGVVEGEGVAIDGEVEDSVDS